MIHQFPTTGSVVFSPRCGRDAPAPAHGPGRIDGLLHTRPRHGGRFYGAGMDVSLARVVPPDARRVRGHGAGPRDGRPFLLRVRHGRGHRPVLYGSVGERRFAHAGSRRPALGDARVRRTHPGRAPDYVRPGTLSRPRPNNGTNSTSNTLPVIKSNLAGGSRRALDRSDETLQVLTRNKL